MEQPGHAALLQHRVQGVGQLGRGPGPLGQRVRRLGLAVGVGVEGELAHRGLVAAGQPPARVPLGQVGQVERALAGQGQVGGERGVAGQAAELQAARGQRVHRPLGVVQRLGLLRVGQPGGQRALVVLGQRGRVEVGVGAVGGGQRQPVEHPGAAAPVPVAARPVRPPSVTCSASHSATSSGPSTSVSMSNPSASAAPSAGRRQWWRKIRSGKSAGAAPAGHGTAACRRAGAAAPGPREPGSARSGVTSSGTSLASSVSWRLRSTSARCSRRLSPARPLTSSTRSTSCGQGAELHHPLGRGLLADPGDAGQVVARVAAQRGEVRVLGRGQPVLLGDRLRREPGHVADPAPGHQHRHVVADQLQHVPVAGDDQHAHALGRRPGWRAWRSGRRPRSRAPTAAGCRARPAPRRSG